MIRSRRGGTKSGESKLASNHFLMCSPQSGSLRDVHGVMKRRGRKKTGGQEDKKGKSKGERLI